MRTVLHLLQLVVLFSLISAVSEQVWYTASVDVDYTDGLPEGSGVEVEVVVDQDSSDGSLHVDGFFTFTQWQTTRNDTTIPSEDVEQTEFDVTPLSEIQQDVPVLSYIIFSLGLLLFVTNLFGLNNTWIIGLLLSVLVLWTFILLAFMAPVGYIGDLDFSSSSNDDNDDSMVHQQIENSFDIGMDEVSIQFTSSSYDLGLVDESELEEVIESAPGDEHRSFVEMQGEAKITWGTFVVELFWSWLTLFFVFPLILSLKERAAIDTPSLLGDVTFQ